MHSWCVKLPENWPVYFLSTFKWNPLLKRSNVNHDCLFSKQEVIMEHNHVLWMDSSIRFKGTGSLAHVKQQYRKTGGIVAMLRVYHSIYSATHEKLYEYFPSNITKLRNLGRQRKGSSNKAIYRSARIFVHSPDQQFYTRYTLSKINISSLQKMRFSINPNVVRICKAVQIIGRTLRTYLYLA